MLRIQTYLCKKNIVALEDSESSHIVQVRCLVEKDYAVLGNLEKLELTVLTTKLLIAPGKVWKKELRDILQ